MVDDVNLIPVAHDPFALDPAFIPHPGKAEWEVQPNTNILQDQNNTANPPGIRQNQDISAYEMGDQVNNWKTHPDIYSDQDLLNQDAQRSMIEKKAFDQWQSMKNDPDFQMTDEQWEHVFPVLPWSPSIKSSFQLTPVSNDPFATTSGA